MAEEAAPSTTDAGSTGADASAPSQGGDVSSHIDRLTSGVLPQREGESQEPQTQEAPVSEPVAKKYRVGEREYTIAEMEQLGMIEDFLITRQQYTNLNKKHQEVLEQLAQRQLQGEQPQQEQQQQGSNWPEPQQILTSYGPVAQQMAEQGHIESDFVEAYPMLSAQMQYIRDIVLDSYSKLQNMLQGQQQQTVQQQKQAFVSEFRGHLDAIAAMGEQFTGLKNPQTRAEFLEYIKNDVDPKAENLMGEKGRKNLQRLWMAFNSSGIQAATDLAKKEQERRAQQTQFSVGEGSGSRPGVVAQDPKQAHIDKLIEGFI